LEQTECPTGRHFVSSVVTCKARAKVGDWPEEDSLFVFSFSLALEVTRGIVLAAAGE
jgi:hypothetical protein